MSIDDAYVSFTDVVTVVITDSQDAAELIDTAGSITHSYPAVPHSRHAYQVAFSGGKVQITQIDLL